MRVLRHEEFNEDILRVVDEAYDKEEMLQCIDKAYEEILKRPFETAELQYPPLKGYRKKKFHSVFHPPRKVNADMRLVYQVYEDQQEIRLFGLSFRNDIYQLLKERHQNWAEIRHLTQNE